VRKLNALGYQLPAVPASAGNYIGYARAGTFSFWVAILGASTGCENTMDGSAMR
jgi:hypothetical protein